MSASGSRWYSRGRRSQAAATVSQPSPSNNGSQPTGNDPCEPTAIPTAAHSTPTAISHTGARTRAPRRSTAKQPTGRSACHRRRRRRRRPCAPGSAHRACRRRHGLHAGVGTTRAATAVADLWMARGDGDNCPRRTSAAPRRCRRGNRVRRPAVDAVRATPPLTRSRRHGSGSRAGGSVRAAARRHPDHPQARRAAAGVGRDAHVRPGHVDAAGVDHRAAGEDAQPAPRPARELHGDVPRPARLRRRRGHAPS